jgi:PKD repeat protein
MEAMTGRRTAGSIKGVGAGVLVSLLTFCIAAPQALAGANDPQASFTFSPSQPQSGDTVTFTAEQSPDITSYTWDFDDPGNACDNASGPTVSTSFGSAGNKSVRLCVSGPGGEDTQTRTVNVRNRPPTAGISFSPAQPRPGDSVIFQSTSTDNEGAVSVTWDLDNDGAFDDDAGATAVRIFDAVGNYTVRVRAVDSNNASATAEVVVPVADAPPPAAQPRFLTPFPVVRITGRTTSRGARIRMLRVQGPAGAQVLVRCKGKRKNCPKKRRQLGTIRSRSARFHRFERHLRGGARLRVIVLAPDSIGKFTRFIVRKGGAAPRRVDSCILWGSTSPQPCSSFTAP